MAFTRFFQTISQTAADTSYAGIFGSSGSSTALPGWTLLDSLSSEGSEIVTWVRYKLGEPILYCELDNVQIFSALEESNIKFSYIINTYQIRNWMSNLYGLNRDFSINDLTGKMPYNSYNFLRRQVQNVGAEADGVVGGTSEIRKAYILLSSSSQEYNVYDFFDNSTSTTIRSYLTTVSGVTNSYEVDVKNIFHYSPITLYRFYDPFSSVNLLSQEFSFESFNTETIFYVLPIWNDVLRAQQLNLNDKVRRSNISYNRIGDVIRIYPKPSATTAATKLWIEYTVRKNPFAPTGSISADASITGISNFSNVPYRDIKYSELNPVSRYWIRQHAFALCLEELGRIRRKFRTVPIPNGDMQLDGDELVREGLEKQDILERQLREDLEKLTNVELMRQESEQMDLINKQLSKLPMRIFLM